MVKLLKTVATAMMITMLVSNQVAAEDGPGGGRPRDGFGGRPSFDFLLNVFDGDDSGDLAEEELPGRVWGRLSQADTDGDGVVTREEFESIESPRGISSL